MPSHIFTRVGAWAESVATNDRSFDAALRGAEQPEAYHASDYLVYADLQMARDDAARAAMERAFAVRVPANAGPVVAYPTAAMPARYAVERGDWRAAMQLVPPAGGTPFTQALTWYAKALGAARTGDTVAAEQAAKELATRQQALVAAGNAYWANEVEIQQRAAAAWIAFAGKEAERGLRRCARPPTSRTATRSTSSRPGRILPARELLGDMLLEAGQPALALREYEASHNVSRTVRGLFGAARAAEAANMRDKAAAYYQQHFRARRRSGTRRASRTR